MSEEGYAKILTSKKTPREVPRKRIKLLSLLGEGQFGEVLKGTVNEMDLTGIPEYIVAVKVEQYELLLFIGWTNHVLKTLKEDPSGQERKELMREAAVMAQFQHPNIVSLVGGLLLLTFTPKFSTVCTRGMPLLLVVQFCEHGALNAYLKRHEAAQDLSSSRMIQMSLEIATVCTYYEYTC